MDVMCDLRFLKAEGRLLISVTTQWTQTRFPDIPFHPFSSAMRSVATQDHIQQHVHYKLVSREIFTDYHCLHVF